jgi:DNA-binding transcriptional ArsR family regulator
MSSEQAPLLKILGDETRKRILLLLNEKGNLNYSDIIDKLEIANTGSLNYHLKVLDGLLLKNDAGQYVLSEKGKLAARLLLEFPEDDGQLYKQWIRANLMSKEPNYLLWGKIFWLIALLSLAILAALNDITIYTMIFPWLFFFNGLLYFIRHYRRSRKNKTQQKEA